MLRLRLAEPDKSRSSKSSKYCDDQEGELTVLNRLHAAGTHDYGQGWVTSLQGPTNGFGKPQNEKAPIFHKSRVPV
jgi:hypothetical protein